MLWSQQFTTDSGAESPRDGRGMVRLMIVGDGGCGLAVDLWVVMDSVWAEIVDRLVGLKMK